ncbi:WD40 repeat domain-containing protein [Candidatus Dependentiae bacterium]|nr:WD40 repeat domain-containing protein [Candidatus Dependentiae bacterium]
MLKILHHPSPILRVTFSPDGKKIVTGFDDNTATLWDAETGRELKTLKIPAGKDEEKNLLGPPVVNLVAFSPDGRKIITVSQERRLSFGGFEDERIPPRDRFYTSEVRFKDNTARIWDSETGQELQALKGHTDTINARAFSPDGKKIITGSQDKTAKIWDVESGKELKTLKGHTNWVTSVAFSPDGKSVATGSFDKTAKIWDAETGQELQTTPKHDWFVKFVSFSPNGKKLYSIGSSTIQVSLLKN